MSPEKVRLLTDDFLEHLMAEHATNGSRCVSEPTLPEWVALARWVATAHALLLEVPDVLSDAQRTIYQCGGNPGVKWRCEQAEEALSALLAEIDAPEVPHD